MSLHSVFLFSLYTHDKQHLLSHLHSNSYTSDYSVRIILKKRERDRERNVSSVFILVPVEYSQQTGRIPAVTPVCTSSGEDASADMLYGDINLANHRANGESS